MSGRLLSSSNCATPHVAPARRRGIVSTSTPAPDGIIAHVNIAAGFRGGERQTELLVRELAARGVRQRLVARQAEALIVRLADVEGLELAPVRGILGAVRALRGAALAHAHEGRCVQATWLAQRTMGVPYLITRRVPRPLGNNPLTRAIYRDAAQLVAISTSIAAQLREYAPGKDIRLVPSAFTPSDIDRQRVMELRQQFGDGPVVGQVAALVRAEKGQGTMIAAARRLPGMRFVFVGSGPDEALLRSEAADLPNVHFTGQVSDVANHLAAFDLFAVPSLYEGLGSILLDAMHAELPIVASNVGGIPDLIRDGRNGLLIPPGNADALVSALERLHSDDALCERFARVNREEISNYTSVRMMERYLPLYRTILPKP